MEKVGKVADDDLKQLRLEWEQSELRECLERSPMQPAYETLPHSVKRVYGRGLANAFREGGSSRL